MVVVVMQWRVLRWRGTPCTPPPKKKRRAQRCHQVNRTRPFPAGSPGVVESGLKDSERVSSLRKDEGMSSRSNCEGRSSWRRPGRNRLQPDNLRQLNLKSKVSELIISFTKLLTESQISTRILRDFCQCWNTSARLLVRESTDFISAT